MPATTLDLRDMPPAERHPTIFEAFEQVPSGEALQIINDHDPQPLYYQMAAEVDEFDAEAYQVDREGDQKFVATLPKK